MVNSVSTRNTIPIFKSVHISITVFALVLLVAIASCSTEGSPFGIVAGEKPVYADVLARPIRVLLAQGTGVTVKVSGSASVFSSSGEKVTDVTGASLQFKFTAGKIQFNGAQSSEFTVQAVHGFLGVAGDEFRGKMRIVATSKDLLLLNIVDVDEYLRGVIPAEMPYTWSIEALKAQAVAARTYAVQRMTKKSGDDWDVVATTADQVYRGIKYERIETDSAISETAGEILTHEGTPIIAYYHADSGGYTKEGSAPYLKPVSSPAPDSPYKYWELSWTHEEFRNLLNAAGKPAGKILDIDATYDPFGRCQSLTFNTEKNSFSMTAHEFRKMVGVMTVRSTKFQLTVAGGVNWNRETKIETGSKITIISAKKERVERAGKLFIANFLGTKSVKSALTVLGKQTTPTVIKVVGSGFGHGTGMSQWGAKYMADNGSTYREILLHYYTGIEIVQMVSVLEE